MHIPDGFLDLKTSITTYLAAGGTLSYGLKKLQTNLDEKDVPLLGLLGAFIFAAQMINIPIAGGTSGHLMGGVLAMLIVGPWAASIVITSILIIQAIFFMDGGLTVLGANILNMAIIQVFIGYYLYNKTDNLLKSHKIRIFIAAFSGTFISAALAAVELAISGIISLTIVLPAMLGWHLIIGILEGLITMLIISYLSRVAPELIKGGNL